MRTHLAHLVFNVEPGNMPFYRDLLTFLGWQTSVEADGMLGVSSGEVSFWLIGQVKPVVNDFDGPGMNHVSIGTETQADVDATVAYLAERGVPALFETPRHRPEFCGSEAETYYQVMFESPDKILFEVVYTGPKAA